MRHDAATMTPHIIEQAAAWFIAMREPQVSADQRAGFASWLRASPVHIKAYLEVTHLWSDAANISPAFALDTSSASVSENIIALHPAEFDLPTPADPLRASRPAMRRNRIGMAAALVATLLISCAWLWAGMYRTVATDVGEQRMITLADGSIVQVNARSKLRVRMTAQARRIELLSGQALFNVAKDPRRPFVVHSGNVAVRAVGTRFDVYKKHSGILVSVVQGKVAVLTERTPSTPQTDRPGAAAVHDESPPPSQAAGANRSVYLSAGEQLRVDPAGRLERPRQADVAATTSWLRQQLVFTGEKLSDVIAEFNRHSRTPIVLVDDSLADLRINAAFNTGSTELLLRFLDRLEGVTIEQSERQIRIVGGAQPQGGDTR